MINGEYYLMNRPRRFGNYLILNFVLPKAVYMKRVLFVLFVMANDFYKSIRPYILLAKGLKK